MGRRPRMAAFTLVELLFVVGVLIATVAWVAPAYKKRVVQGQMFSAASGMMRSINLARQEAITRSETVSI